MTHANTTSTFKLSIKAKLLVIIAITSLLASAPLFFFTLFAFDVTIVIVTFFLLCNLAVTDYLTRDIKEGLNALETGLLNLKDGEYSTTLAYQNNDELGNLCKLFNQTVMQLRDEKQGLFQRELLLDKVTQSSPEVLFLVNDKHQVVFSNVAAKRFFNRTSRLEGEYLEDLYLNSERGVKEALQSTASGLFSLGAEHGDSSTWHKSTGKFLLNSQSHTLYILKQMTRELSRQEVAVWKKVIRVISHELNNSLGPISSMLHSGKILSEHLKEEKLSRVFSTIDERIQHLCTFVQGYGKFAKLPEPKLQKVHWQSLIETLSTQWQFTDASKPALDDKTTITADAIQLEQLLINLLKNAHESGSPSDSVAIALQQNTHETDILVMDRGTGVSSSVMNSALIPFYSTKSNGSGLGLALCREIVDAHHGHIGLQNRQGGGLVVKVTLPNVR